MQKAMISARSGRRPGGRYPLEMRAKPDAKSDDFGAVLARSGRRSGGCFASLKREKPDAKSDDFGTVASPWVDTVGYSGREGQGQGTQWEGGGWPGYSGIQWVDTVGYSGRGGKGQGTLRLIETVSASALP